MKKTGIAAGFLLVCFSMILTGCGGTGETGKDIEKDGTEQEEQLLTAGQLREEAEADLSQYSDEVLEEFISDFEITEGTVGDYNIGLLLQEYEPSDSSTDVSGIFDADAEPRTGNYTEDVSAVAFLENSGTSLECVYYDLEAGHMYYSEEEYLFTDLTQAEPIAFSDGEQLVAGLDALGVFTWKDQPDAEPEPADDGIYVELAVRYTDGTVFRYETDGIPSEVLPERYDEVYELLTQAYK